MPRKTDSSNPADWLFIAASDLEGVQELVSRQISYGMCRSKLAEILEKILKAELIRQGWFLLKTHDLEVLRKELLSRDRVLAEELAPFCAGLAEVHFRDRYPGFDLEEENWSDLRVKLEDVVKLFASIQARIAGSA